MSWSWFIHSTLPPGDVASIEAEFEQALADFFEEHGESEEELPPIGAGGGPPPTPDAYIAACREYRHQVVAAVCERLPQCRITVEVENVRGGFDDSPLLISAMRFWLERCGTSIVDWGDHQLELGEDVLARLARRRGRGRLGEAKTPTKKRKPIARREAKPGELRAIAILRILDRAEDPAIGFELRRRLPGISDGARRYLQLLANEGPMSDRQAARRLDIRLDELSAYAGEVELVMARIDGS